MEGASIAVTLTIAYTPRESRQERESDYQRPEKAFAAWMQLCSKAQPKTGH
jgi:hypothetical protein